MQLTGQRRAQSVQPMHLSGRMKKVSRSRHLPAGHFLSLMCARYSASKYFSVEIAGFGAV
jgi:hypothetical protein